MPGLARSISRRLPGFTVSPQPFGYFPGAPFLLAAGFVILAVSLFLFVAVRFDLSHKPSVALHPKTPEMSPPGQMNIPTAEKDEDEEADRA